MKKIVYFRCLIIILVSIGFIGCATTTEGPKEFEIKEFSTPSGDIKLTIDPKSGYVYKSTRYGISFSFPNPKRFSLWAGGLENYPTGKGKAFKDGMLGQRGGRMGDLTIAAIHDAYEIANMQISVMKKADSSTMEKLFQSWHQHWHRAVTVLTLKYFKEDLKLPSGITGERIQYIVRNPDGSYRMDQFAYLDIPKDRFLIISVGSWGTYGDNTRELFELIKSVQLIPISAAISETISFPSTVSITIPDPNLPKEMAAFSGIWEGAWDGVLLSRLAVEKIDLKRSVVVYGWTDHPKGRFSGGWVRETAKILKGGIIEWGGGDSPKFTFTMGKEFKSIDGKREFRGEISRITMIKKE